MTPEDLQRAQEQLRDRLLARLLVDLVGPASLDESIEDRPSDRYLTGILYPVQTEIREDEDETLSVEGGNRDADADDDDSVALVSTLKPSAAGVSFALRRSADGHATVTAHITCGTYALADEGSDLAPSQRRWKRTQHHVRVGPLAVLPGAARTILASEGLPGLELHLQVAPWEADTFTVTAALANKNARGASRNESEERTFFQCVLEIEPGVGCKLVERPSRRMSLDEDERIAALIYREAKELASGHTCAAEWDVRDGNVERVRTTWLPQSRVDGVSELGAEQFRPLRDAGRLGASWLATAAEEDLLSALLDIVTAYRGWIDAQETLVASRVPAPLQRQCADNLKVCRGGAERMAAAVEFLRRDRMALRAFQLAQEAMAKQRMWATKKALEWRPFQLGFQLLTLESVADRAHADRRTMDLLWFPTGGGKTEAYLAITAFILIYRRLRKDNVGDGGGVAVIMRYTLRLLTIQQFQRAAAVICACDVIRTRESSLGDVAFSVGLWVGNGATPATREDARKTEGGADYRQLTGCPACGASLRWSVPKTGMSVHCDDKKCELSGRPIPVWTIDEDIYEITPSLVIGTVDKFAQIVRKTDTASLFGRGPQPHHPPDLIIQDELHLISGPLGSMTGLYESVIDELCTAAGACAKVIGSTATIRRARDQIRALFNRSAYQFPAPGLDASDSGFAVRDTSKPGRIYLGITTAGRSAKYTVQGVAAALLQASGAPSTGDNVRDPYWTLVSYFNTLRELGGSLILMQDDVPITMGQIAARRGEPTRSLVPPRELTSRVTSAEVRDMLQDLNLREGAVGAVDVLLASSMISVGVDIPRLGLMMVVGQPKTISEYIQATSRVGRERVPGLVVGVYNSGRARDRSFFETFSTWHATLYRDVEATSVTPFAPRAQDKALHAVLVALARHLVPSLRSDPPRLSKASRTRLEQLIQPILARAGAVDPTEAQGVMSRIKVLLDEWEIESPNLDCYWDDFGKRRSLLISAEQDAAGEQDSEARRALWPTPNSMREVEPTTSFKVLSGLLTKEVGDGQQ